MILKRIMVFLNELKKVRIAGNICFVIEDSIIRNKEINSTNISDGL